MFRKLWTMITKAFKREPLKEILIAEERIQQWDALYIGEPEWLKYNYVNMYGHKVERRRKTMKPAKLITGELSSLIFSEMPETNFDESVKEILEVNRFWQLIPEKLDRGFALGGTVCKLYVQDGQIKIDYVPASRFIPVSWKDGVVIEADFFSRKVVDAEEYIKVESHRIVQGTEESQGGIEIITKAYKPQGSTMIEADLSKVYQASSEKVFVPVSVPLFYYYRNPGANNFDADSPLGISIYANAVDTLESLDIAFDGLQAEILLGKKRIIVPASAVRTTYVTEDGEDKPVRFFDPNDEVFTAFDFEEQSGLKIVDNSVELRIEEIVKAIQALLDIYSVQTGFSPGFISFGDDGGIKTATEVVSENSKTFKTKKSYENAIGCFILDLANGIRELGRLYGVQTGEDEYAVFWNDSVIEDSQAKQKRILERYAAKTIPLWRVLAELDGLQEEEARKLAEEIRGESATVDINSLFGGAE